MNLTDLLNARKGNMSNILDIEIAKLSEMNELNGLGIFKRNGDPLERATIIDSIKFEGCDYCLSVQASEIHYSHPRLFLPFEEYTHFEVMANLPEEDVPLNWQNYGSLDTVFGYVPKEEIEQLLEVLDRKYKII